MKGCYFGFVFFYKKKKIKLSQNDVVLSVFLLAFCQSLVQISVSLCNNHCLNINAI